MLSAACLCTKLLYPSCSKFQRLKTRRVYNYTREEEGSPNQWKLNATRLSSKSTREACWFWTHRPGSSELGVILEECTERDTTRVTGRRDPLDQPPAVRRYTLIKGGMGGTSTNSTPQKCPTSPSIRKYCHTEDLQKSSTFQT